jgi:hypothetical protein
LEQQAQNDTDETSMETSSKLLNHLKQYETTFEIEEEEQPTPVDVNQLNTVITTVENPLPVVVVSGTLFISCIE